MIVTKKVEVEIEIELSDWTIVELLEELKTRKSDRNNWPQEVNDWLDDYLNSPDPATRYRRWLEMCGVQK